MTLKRLQAERPKIQSRHLDSKQALLATSFGIGVGIGCAIAHDGLFNKVISVATGADNF
jgi:hypothetical protein